jgi:hypothetical protein
VPDASDFLSVTRDVLGRVPGGLWSTNILYTSIRINAQLATRHVLKLLFPFLCVHLCPCVDEINDTSKIELAGWTGEPGNTQRVPDGDMLGLNFTTVPSNYAIRGEGAALPYPVPHCVLD